MSDRDVRRLAEEIRSLSLDLLRKGRHVDYADVEPVLATFLAEREEGAESRDWSEVNRERADLITKKITAGLSATEQERLDALQAYTAEMLAELAPRPELPLAALEALVREPELQAQLHRALGEGARLRVKLEVARTAIESLDDDALGTGSVAVTTPDGESGEMRWPLRDELLDKINKDLASSPLSERAGAVMREAGRVDEVICMKEGDSRPWPVTLESRYERFLISLKEAVDALRAELSRAASRRYEMGVHPPEGRPPRG